MSDLNKALAVIQQTMKVPKSQRNNFGKYNYRNCEDILQAVTPLLGECILTISDEMVMVGERYYVKATACIQLGKEKVEVTAFAREEENKKGMDSAQLTGSTSSYARKYACNGLFAIDDTKDADSMDNRQQPAKAKPSNNHGAATIQQQVEDFFKLDNDARNKAWPNIDPAIQNAINQAAN